VNLPTSPDGRWHYHVAYHVAGAATIGETVVANGEPLLATDNSVAIVRRAIADNANLHHIIITSISLLAMPAPSGNGART
jgi:hypothetical protein